MNTREEFEARRLELFESIGKPMTPRRITDSEGREIYTMAHGSGDPVVIIHGGLSQASEWAPLVRRLGDGRRLILVDRPGCGLSYSIDYRGVDYRRHAVDYIAAVLDGLDLERPDVVANSMGAYFALVFALENPDHVRSLGLVGAPAGLAKFIPYPVRAMSLPVLGPLLLGADMTPEQMRERVYQGLLVRDASRVSDEQLEVSNLANKVPGAVQAARTMLRNCVGLTGWRRLIRDEVADLDVHTRFVWGSHDQFESPESGRELAERMPDAEFVLVEDAGHLPWHDHPEECAMALLDLWKQESSHEDDRATAVA